MANQFLLFIGIKRSLKAPDEVHVYGYGQERFVWALISACGVFFIGAGATIYHGIHTLTVEDAEVHVGMLTIGLLVFSFIVEIISVGIALKELKGDHPTIMVALKKGDPSTVAIVYEDGVALLGIVIALVNLWLIKITGWVILDAIGSIVVGVILGVMAVVLINKNRVYLIEKAMPEDVKAKVMAKLDEMPVVDKVVNFKSTTVSLAEYRVKFETSLNPEALVTELYKDKGLAGEFSEARSEDEFLLHSQKLAGRVTDAVAQPCGRYRAPDKRSRPGSKTYRRGDPLSFLPSTAQLLRFRSSPHIILVSVNKTIKALGDA